MNIAARIFPVICLIAFLTVNSFGWNARGHMIVAAVAYQVLQTNNPNEIAQVIELLRYHPDYPTWVAEYQNAKPDVKAAYTAENYYFMRAAIWPDDIRSSRHPRRAEHKGQWHFVNYPLRLPASIDFGTIVPATNIFIGYDRSVAAINTPAADRARRAMQLAWIFHLVGDVHQPLHTVALRTDQHPSGDSGGNANCIRPDAGTYRNNLHSFWDGLYKEKSTDLYTGFEARRDALYFIGAARTVRFSQFAGAPNMSAWAKESAQFALSDAYQYQGSAIPLSRTIEIRRPDGSKDQVCPDGQTMTVAPNGYTANAQRIAAQRMLLAGYRLANVLTKLQL